MEEPTQTMPFGMVLKRYRRAARLTQEMLAERAGYSTTYLSKLERGDRQPLALTVVSLAEALGLSSEERATLEEAARHAPVQQRAHLLIQKNVAETGDAAPPLVGRADELARLKQHLAGEGPPLLLLAGEPGIGKTRLLKEAARLGQAQGWQMLMGSCHPSSSQEPYSPMIEALEQFLRQQSLEDQRHILEEHSWLARLFPELLTESHPAPPWNLAPDQERRLLFITVGRFLAQVAGSVGTLLVLDDLHWAGADVLDLLTSLIRPGSPASVRIVGAYRQTEVQAQDSLAQWLAELARMGAVEPMNVDSLPPAEAAALLRTLLADSRAEVPGPLEERILQRAGGVPYFLVSYAQGVRSRALLGDSIPETIGEVPWSVAETVRQRVAALPETARYLLGVVSIVGQETTRSLLLGLATQLGWGRLDVLEAVERACQARLLEEQRAGVYRFPHELIREVIEADLSGLRRVILHQQVGEILEQQPGMPSVERLAYHFLRGEQPEKAARYLELAGDRAVAMYAHAEAEQAYRTWLELVTPLGQEAEAAAQEKLAGVLRVLGRYAEALELLEAARATYQAANDLEALARIMGKLGQLHAARGAAEVGIALLESWLAELPSGIIPAQRQGGLTLTLAYLFLNSSRPDEALAAAERAAAFAEQAHDNRLFEQAQWHIGRSLLLLNRLGEAITCFEAALPLAERAGDVYSLYYIHLNLALITHSRGDLRQSRQHSERAIALAEQMSNPLLLAQALGSQAHTTWSLGEWQQSRQEYERSIALMRQIGMPWGATYPLLNFGLQLLAEGQEEAGRTALEEAISLAKSSQDRQAERVAQSILASYDLLRGLPEDALKRLQPLVHEAEREESGMIACLPVLAWAYLELGNTDQAQRLTAEALARTRAQQMRGALAEALQVQVRIAVAGRRWAEAACALDEAFQLAQIMSCPYDEARLHVLAGQIALHQEQPVEARQQFEKALRLLRQLGEQRYIGQVEQALAKLRNIKAGG